MNTFPFTPRYLFLTNFLLCNSNVFSWHLEFPNTSFLITFSTFNTLESFIFPDFISFLVFLRLYSPKLNFFFYSKFKPKKYDKCFLFAIPSTVHEYILFTCSFLWFLLTRIPYQADSTPLGLFFSRSFPSLCSPSPFNVFFVSPFITLPWSLISRPKVFLEYALIREHGRCVLSTTMFLMYFAGELCCFFYWSSWGMHV